MPAYKHKVILSAKQRNRLEALSKRGQVSARKLARAHMLLLADQNRPQGAMNDNQIHQILNVSQATVIRVRKKFATCGLETAIEECASRCGRPLTFDGYQRAQITALACSTPPEGHSQWSLRLLRPVSRLGAVELSSHETVGVIFKKTD